MKEYRLYVYKSNTDIVDVTNECLNFKYDAGSVMETGDLFPDNPVKTLQCSLINTNNKQYSPHYNKGKIKYISTTLNLVSGVYLYDLPFENTLMIYDKSQKYLLNIMQGKVRVGNVNGVQTESIPVKIAYLDITEENPLNYVDTEFSPLIQEGNRVSLYEDTVSYSFLDYLIQGNGTDTLTVYNTGSPQQILVMGSKVNFTSENYYDMSQKNYFVECGKNYYKATMQDKEFNQDASCGYLELSLMNYYDLSQQNYEKLCNIEYCRLKVVSWEKIGNTINIKFDRKIDAHESIFLYIAWRNASSEFLKFDGYIVDVVNSDLETVSFGCKDRAYDLQNVKIDYTDIRGYDSKTLTDTTFETLSETISATINSSSCTSTYNDYTQLFALNDNVGLYNGTNYIKAVISNITSSSMTFTGYKDDGITVVTIPDGIYTIHKVYNPTTNPYYFEYFMQDVLDDTGSPYNVTLGSRNLFAYLPKAEEIQYIDLWSLYNLIVLLVCLGANLLLSIIFR